MSTTRINRGGLELLKIPKLSPLAIYDHSTHKHPPLPKIQLDTVGEAQAESRTTKNTEWDHNLAGGNSSILGRRNLSPHTPVVQSFPGNGAYPIPDVNLQYFFREIADIRPKRSKQLLLFALLDCFLVALLGCFLLGYFCLLVFLLSCFLLACLDGFGLLNFV
jgi:hypothetical protein